MDRKGPNIAMVHGADRKPPSGAAGTVHTARGEVRSVDVRIGIVALKHEPVKSLNWPSMTMSFKVRDRQLLERLSVGQRVEFDFVRLDNNYYVTAVR